MSIFSIGLSGLNAARNALYVASNNISNVNTPGYNREVVMLSEKGAGRGVQVADIQRQFNRYVAQQLNAANSRTSGLEAYHGQVSQIDNLLADQDAGLAPLMQNFFSAVGDLAAHPSDPAARQGVVGNANTLAAQFRSFDRYLSDMTDGVNGQLHDQVTQINNLTGQIAHMNRQVALAKAKVGKAPNSLLNQRDHLVAELARHVDINATVQDNGTYNISIGNGQPLVSGNRHFKLETLRSDADPTRIAIGYHDSGGNLIELTDETFSGGTLGGLLKFRDQSLIPTRNKLGQLAASFAAGINQVQTAGVDIEGNAGQAMFAVGQPRVYSNARNTGTASMSASFGDISQLTSSDYTLQVTDAATGTFKVTRIGTRQSFTATLDAGNQLHLAGVTLTVANPAQLADGDTFELQPTRAAAGGMDNLIQDGSLIAAASTSGGSGNNENALALEKLQRQDLVGGAATVSQAYASLVGDVGNQTSTVQVNLKAQQGLSDQLTKVQQSQSGVSLDEEAANLIRYQHYYQANAQVIQAGASILDTILRLR
ncbi:MAG TPA: flagellar hook-associated protein FlgK [Oleiagrimonas sp.]|nr:flagellar hook-associated protein FlgK [Oleiagrimonas sp.]